MEERIGEDFSDGDREVGYLVWERSAGRFYWIGNEGIFVLGCKTLKPFHFK